MDAVEKCHIPDLCRTGGYGYVADGVTIVKATVGDRCKCSGHGDRTEFFTAGKTAGAECSQLAAEIDFAELFTFCEAFRSDGLNIFASGYRRQSVAAFERIVADGGERVRN